MYIPKSIVDWFLENHLRDKLKIYCDYYDEVYPPFDNTCSKEEYMENLDKAIAEIKKKQQNNK